MVCFETCYYIRICYITSKALQNSNRQWIAGPWRRQVYLQPSGFKSRHTSTKSNSAIWSLITLTALVRFGKAAFFIYAYIQY